MGSYTTTEIGIAIGLIRINLTTEYPVSIYKLAYVTIDTYGLKRKASGTIALPSNLNNTKGVIGSQHGTIIHKGLAPSQPPFK